MSSENPGLVVACKNRAVAWQITKEMFDGENLAPGTHRFCSVTYGKETGPATLWFISPSDIHRRCQMFIGDWVVKDVDGYKPLNDRDFKLFYEVKHGKKDKTSRSSRA